jgi:hypothetical protein
MKGLTVRAKAIKLLEKNTGFALSAGFLVITQKHRQSGWVQLSGRVLA